MGADDRVSAVGLLPPVMRCSGGDELDHLAAVEHRVRYRDADAVKHRSRNRDVGQHQRTGPGDPLAQGEREGRVGVDGGIVGLPGGDVSRPER